VPQCAPRRNFRVVHLVERKYRCAYFTTMTRATIAAVSGHQHWVCAQTFVRNLEHSPRVRTLNALGTVGVIINSGVTGMELTVSSHITMFSQPAIGGPLGGTVLLLFGVVSVRNDVSQQGRRTRVFGTRVPVTSPPVLD